MTRATVITVAWLSLGLTALAAAGDGKIQLDWADNSEVDLSGYNVYRAGAPGVAVTTVNRIAQKVSASTYLDTSLVESTKYHYVVTAVDTSGNESGPSGEASATTLSAATYGDANQDGSVNMADLNTLVDWILGRKAMPSAGSAAFVNSDVNGDNAVGMADLNLFVDRILGRITKFPVE